MGKASRQRRQKQRQQAHSGPAGAGGSNGSSRPGGPGGSAPGAAFGFGQGAGDEPGLGGLPTEKERAFVAIAAAMTSLSDGDRDAYARHLTVLASERTPSWTGRVSRGIVETFKVLVGRAWLAGWQPAELTRHAARELSQQHASMAADMIVNEMRTYAAATVEPRWAAQVASVADISVAGSTTPGSSGSGSTGSGSTGSGSTGSGSTGPGKSASSSRPWWGSEADYLGAWAKQSGAVGGLRDAIATAIELINLLQRMRILERLLPLPGERAPGNAKRTAAQPTASAPSSSSSSAPSPGSGPPANERLLGRIRALLAKAESTEYAEEAEALSARAQELMTKYSIDQALLAADSGREDQPAGRRLAVDSPYEGPKTSLLQAVAIANRCRVVWLKDVGLATVIGFESDLDAVEVLFTSLLVQANTAMLRAGSKQDAYGGSRTRSFRQSFLVSYAIRIGERLEETAAHATKEAAAEQEAAPAASTDGARSTGTALVPFLAARQQAVDDAVDEIFSNSSLRPTRGVRVTDADGWASGRAAADQASLHNHTPAVTPRSA